MKRLAWLLCVGWLLVAAGAHAEFDLVIHDGRVMDPSSGLDRVVHVGIRDGKIAELSDARLEGKDAIDAKGLVVAPGFIDIHVHGQHEAGYDFMARDGVTTALDLEAGATGFESFVADREGRTRIHYGVAAGHIGSRVKAKHGLSPGHVLTRQLEGGFLSFVLRFVQRWFRPTGWVDDPADADELQEILDILEADLAAGAVGIGMGLAYTPGADEEELAAVFALAARRGVPVFVHMRGQESPTDTGPLEHVMKHARESGAALHVVHVNSSSLAAIETNLATIEAAVASGMDITTEAYPYTAASTLIEAALFDEGFREKRGIDYGDLQWVATGERLTAESFARYRKQGGPVIMHMMKPEWIEAAIAHPLVMIASDGMPMVPGAHPRGAGSHARVLGHYVREENALGLMQAISKLSLMPAQRLEAFVPAMKTKGRIGLGMDADLTLFDPRAVRDMATFEAPLQYSEGIPHVLVEGVCVVRGGELVEFAAGEAPGRAVRAEP